MKNISHLPEDARLFILALGFLTRIPMPPDPDFTPERMTAATGWFPAVGALIGLAVGAFFAAGTLLWPAPIAALVAVGLGLWLTGGLHEDGLADLIDGLGGAPDKARALEIMRDSRLGTYGALALLVVLGLRVSALAALGPALGLAALVAGGALGRLGVVQMMRALPYARDAGAVYFAGEGVPLRSRRIALACTGLAIVPVGLMAPGAVPVALAGGFGAWMFLARLMRRRLGGHTGDGLGATALGIEVAVLLGVLAWA